MALIFANLTFYKLVLALSSWEGKVSDEELDNVEKMAPLMKEFGYKPELHFGSYDHFLRKTSKFFYKNIIL